MSERISEGEIRRLFRDYRAEGRRKDRNRLVEAHLGFAHYLAHRYSDRGIETEDLEQTALLALVKAVDRYDPDVGVAFTSFAGRTIEGELKRHFRDSAWGVRVPRSTKELHLRVRRATDELTHKLGRSPSIRDIADHLDVASDEIVEALGASAAFTSSSIDAYPDGDETQERSGWLADDDDDLTGADDKVLAEELMEMLPDREREIVRLRFYEDLTQSEIADRVGISQMHVSRLLRRSFQTMRETQGTR